MTELKIRCLIRGELVKAAPEEVVRQRLLRRLTDHLGYPASLIALEKKLEQMPHLELGGKAIPDRRADLVCFAKGIVPGQPLYPLLLIECKAVPMDEKAVRQVTGYNRYLRAFFVGLVNGEEERLGYYDPKIKNYRFIPRLLPYQELLNGIRNPAAAKL